MAGLRRLFCDIWFSVYQRVFFYCAFEAQRNIIPEPGKLTTTGDTPSEHKEHPNQRALSQGTKAGRTLGGRDSGRIFKSRVREALMEEKYTASIQRELKKS